MSSSRSCAAGVVLLDSVVGRTASDTSFLPSPHAAQSNAPTIAINRTHNARLAPVAAPDAPVKGTHSALVGTD
jgi:hypothetical protein